MAAGSTIGAYEIIAVVGHGGMATVYKAYHRRLNRHVAIKMILQGQHDDPAFRGRFEREAQIVANLEHPNIVPVYDYAEYEGNPYLVMKYIEGVSLKAILGDGALQITDIFRIIKPIAAAIDYAHGHGVLHRDIKPSNILLDKAQTPFLSDFGLARLTLAPESTLSADMVIGTPYYISPEQALGKAEIGSRADLYSFGVVLYELLVGKVPYSDGTPYAIIHDHIYRELPLPSVVNPNVPKAAEAVLIRALAKDPEARYPSAMMLIDELSNALAGENSAALHRESRHAASDTLAKPRNLTPVSDLGQASKGNRRIWIPILLAVILITALVIFGVLRNRSLRGILALPTIQPTIVLSTPVPTTAPLTLYAVPVMRLDEAQSNLNANPTDAIAYLALARAMMQQRRPDQTTALQTITDGIPYADDVTAYVMTAAQIARDVGRLEVAFEIYLGAIRRSEGTAVYPLIRTQAGSAAYQMAIDSTLIRPLFAAQVAREIDREPSALVSVLVARALIQNGNFELADRVLGRALTQDRNLAEAHLILGELHAARNRMADARAQWNTVLQNPDAPEWVRDRANSLLNDS